LWPRRTVRRGNLYPSRAAARDVSLAIFNKGDNVKFIDAVCECIACERSWEFVGGHRRAIMRFVRAALRNDSVPRRESCVMAGEMADAYLAYTIRRRRRRHTL
jgi:hypothetical protein